MNGRIIQCQLGIIDTQETGTLRKGIRPETGDFEQLFAVGERAVFLAVFDDVLATAALIPAICFNKAAEAVFSSTPT